jgi:hypothetical protein
MPTLILILMRALLNYENLFPNYIIQQAMQIPIATFGVGYPEPHAPDDNIRLNDYIKTARHLVRVLVAFGQN